MPTAAQSICEQIIAFWVALSEIIRNIGLVAAASVGIYLAWKRVVASNKQADAQFRQAELTRRDHVAELFNRVFSTLLKTMPGLQTETDSHRGAASFKPASTR
jgi:hypothetical protein